MGGLSIMGVGVVGGFGCGVEDLYSTLASGNALIPHFLPPSSQGRPGPPVLLADHAPLERFLNKRATRRIDHFSCLALLGAFLALEDADLLGKDLDGLGVVMASGYGPTRTTFAFLDSYMDEGDAFASPTLFSNSVHNAAAAHVAIQLGIAGPNLTISQFELSVASGLLAASRWISEGRVKKVLFGAVDEYCPVLGYCWEQMVSQRGEQPIQPFDLENPSAVPAEGSAFFLLTGDERDARYGVVDEVKVDGFAQPAQPFPSDPGIFVLGADGHPDCSSRYVDIIPADARVSAYTPLYGSLPIGQAFDLAAASLAVREDTIFQTPGGGGFAPWRIADEGSLGAGSLQCVKIGAEGGYGLVRVRKKKVKS